MDASTSPADTSGDAAIALGIQKPRRTTMNRRSKMSRDDLSDVCLSCGRVHEGRCNQHKIRETPCPKCGGQMAEWFTQYGAWTVVIYWKCLQCGYQECPQCGVQLYEGGPKSNPHSLECQPRVEEKPDCKTCGRELEKDSKATICKTCYDANHDEESLGSWGDG